MKRICYINSYACLGGAEKSLLSLITEFTKKEYEVFVILGERGEYYDLLKKNNVNVSIIPQPSFREGYMKFVSIFYLLKFLFLMFFFIKKNKIDIIHTNTFRSRLYTFPLCLFFRGKMIAHVRDIEQSKLNYLLVKAFNTTIAISNAVKNVICLDIDKKDDKKIKVIHNGIEFNDIVKPLDDGVIKIAMFARFDEWKCQHVFVESISKLNFNTNNKSVKYYIYGDAIRSSEVAYKDKIIDMVKEYHLDEVILFMGYCKNPITEMAKMDLIVCPSDNEPFGRVIIEAMSMKKMVLASSNGGIPEILSSEFSELLFPPRDSEILANKIEHYIENKEYFDSKFKDSLYEKYVSNFSINALVREVEKEYCR